MSKPVSPLFFFEDIEDKETRENFRKLDSYLKEDTNLLGFHHFEIIIDRAVTNLKYPHSLGFQPKDVLMTSQIGSGTITWNYDLFDENNLDITTTGPTTVRAYIGTHVEGSL